MIKSFQDHVDRAKKIDEDVLELQEEAENNIRIKKEFEDLRTELQEELKNQVEVIQRQEEEIEEMKNSGLLNDNFASMNIQELTDDLDKDEAFVDDRNEEENLDDFSRSQLTEDNDT